MLALTPALVLCSSLALGQPAGLASTPEPGQTLVTPIAVFGRDDRQDLPDRLADLTRKIGTLTLDGSSICTAFCVAPGVIATASHCLFGTAGSEKSRLTKFAFKVGAPGRSQSSRIAGATEAEARENIRSGTENLSLSPPIAAANDWAVARLAQPICTAGGLALSEQTRGDINDAAAGGKLFQAAMHRDLPAAKIVFGGPCAIKTALPDASAAMIARDFANPDSIILHDCDTGPGSSGSPMLIDTANGPEVIGINVGTYVLSRVLNKTAENGGNSHSEPIANTAVEAARFRDAVEELGRQPHFSVLQRLKPAGMPAH